MPVQKPTPTQTHIFDITNDDSHETDLYTDTRSYRFILDCWYSIALEEEIMIDKISSV